MLINRNMTAAGIPIGVISTDFDSDAYAWQDAVEANGGTVSWRRLSHISYLIRALKNAGIWALTDDMWIAGETDGDSVQTCTSLKQLRLATVSGTVGFVDSAVIFNGGHIKTGFIPNTHGSVLTGSNQRLDCWQTTNANFGYAMGTQSASGQNSTFRPRSSGLMTAALCATSLNGPSTSDGSGHSGAQRAGTTEAFFWQNGAAVTAGGPWTFSGAGSTLSSREIYLGALNNVGVASTAITGRLRWWAVGASLTAQQWSDYYTVLNNYFIGTAPGSPIYVSNVSYGGIPIGNDSTGLGTTAAPYLTIDAGIASVPVGGEIALNGNPASPATYKSAASLTITKGLTIKSIYSLGAILASGTGTSSAVRIQPTGAATIVLDGVIVDPSLNTAGAASHGIVLAAGTTQYSFTAQNSLIRNWITYGVTNGSGLDAHVRLSNTDLTGGTCSAGVYLTLSGGSFTSDTGTTVTLTDQNAIGGGGVMVTANAAGVTASVLDTTVNVVSSITSGNYIYGINLINIRGALIDGDSNNTGTRATSTVSCDASDSVAGVPLSIMTNKAGDATELPCDDSAIVNYVAYSYGTAGVGAQLSGEGGDKTKQNRLRMENVTVYGNAQSAAGGLHGLFAANTTDSTITNCQSTTTGLGIVDKRNLRLTIEDTTTTGFTNSGARIKGTDSSLWDDVEVTLTAGSAPLVYVSADDPGGTGDSTGVVVRSVASTINGGTNAQFALVDSGQGVTFQTNSWELDSGSVAAYPFTYLGVPLSTFAEWKAVAGPTDTSNIP